MGANKKYLPEKKSQMLGKFFERTGFFSLFQSFKVLIKGRNILFPLLYVKLQRKNEPAEFVKMITPEGCFWVNEFKSAGFAII